MAHGKVLLAMSGGVDSSAAAIILKSAGYQVEGATMRLWSDGGNAAEQSIFAAKQSCSLLGIKHRVLDYEQEFKDEIVGYFIDEYKRGRTPNPCVLCNKRFKFGRFYCTALDMDFDYMATGHYARIADEGGRKILKTAKYAPKDQTYVLYGLRQDMLRHVLFPLGGYSKDEIRRIAAENGLPNAAASDSQDICFISGDYSEFIKKYGGIEAAEGNFIDTDGNILGRHCGITNYTIGQRKGLGIALGEPAYVTEINPAANTVTLGKNRDTYASAVACTDYNFIGNMREMILCARAKIRYSSPLADCSAEVKDGVLRVNFTEPQRAAAPGQSVVLYDGERVLGGGVIDTVIRGQINTNNGNYIEKNLL